MQHRDSLEAYRHEGWTSDIKLVVALVLTARRWRAIVDEKLRPLGQSSARMEALSAIMAAPEPSSQVVIAKRLRIEGPTMTRMIDALSRDGLVERRTSPSDRRTKHLSLTPAGEQALREMFAVVDPMRADLLGGLGGEDRAHLQGVLDALLLRLDANLATGERTEQRLE